MSDTKSPRDAVKYAPVKVGIVAAMAVVFLALVAFFFIFFLVIRGPHFSNLLLLLFSSGLAAIITILAFGFARLLQIYFAKHPPHRKSK